MKLSVAVAGAIAAHREDPYLAARQWKERTGGRVVGYYLTAIPEEIVYAAEALPVAVLDAPAGSRGNSHLPPWSCSLSQEVMQASLGGRLSFLDGFILPQICDTTKTMAGIWEQNDTFGFLANLLWPHRLKGGKSSAFFVRQLEELAGRLAAFLQVEITAAGLQAAIALCNRNRRLLQELFTVYRQDAGAISLKDLYSLVEMAMQIPKEESNSLLEQALGDLRVDGRSADSATVHIFGVGKLVRPRELWDVLDAAGVVLCGDAISAGGVYAEGRVREDIPPWEALAEYYLSRYPFDTFFYDHSRRAEALLERVRASRARGVVFIHLGFCEPQNYSFPPLRDALEREGIPCLLLETELGGQSLIQGQGRTRIQAFTEMLAEREGE